MSFFSKSVQSFSFLRTISEFAIATCWATLALVFFANALLMWLFGGYSLFGAIIMWSILTVFVLGTLQIFQAVFAYFNQWIVFVAFFHVAITIPIVMFSLQSNGPLMESLRNEKIYFYILHDPTAAQLADYSITDTSDDHRPFVVKTFKEHARELFIQHDSAQNWEQHWDTFCKWFDTHSQGNPPEEILNLQWLISYDKISHPDKYKN